MILQAAHCFLRFSPDTEIRKSPVDSSTVAGAPQPCVLPPARAVHRGGHGAPRHLGHTTAIQQAGDRAHRGQGQEEEE